MTSGKPEQLGHGEAARQAAVADALPANIALLDARGVVISVNQAWRQFADANGLRGPAYEIGVNYLEVCDRAQREGSGEAERAAAAIRSALAGSAGLSVEYPCHSPTEQRWFLMTATPVSDDFRGGAVVMHLDVTERKRAEEILRQVSRRVVRSRREQIRVELLVLVAATAAFFGLSLRFNWFEATTGWISAHAPNELDEAIVTMVFMIAGLTVFTFRRWRESESELTTRHRSHAVMELLRDELERRVTQRTEELGRANHALKAEITERKRAEDEIRVTDTILKTQQETSPDAILVVDKDSRILSYNQGFIDVWRLSPELVSARLDAPVLQSVADQVENPGEFVARVQYLNEPRDDKSHEELSLKDGRIIDRYSAPVVGADRKYHGRVWYFRDITERKRVEEALRRSDLEHTRVAEELEAERARLVMAQRVAKVGSWETDMVTRAVVWSEETHRIHETDPGTFRPTHAGFLEFVHPDDRRRVDEAFLRSFEKRSPSSVEHRLLLPDGRIKSVEERWRILVDGEGVAIRAVGTCQDITERKTAEGKIVHLSRVHAMLSGINTLIVRVRDRDELFKEACRIAVEAGGFRMSLIAVVDPRANRIVPVASAGKDEGLLSAVNDLLSGAEVAPTTMVARAIRKKKAIVSNDSQKDPRVLLGARYTESAVRSIAVLPLIVSDEAVGVLALYSDEVEFFHQEEMKLLTELADDIAFSLGTIRAQAEKEEADEALRSSLKEKEALLKEVHHRVKNNMQVITSLLRLESNRIDHPTTKSVLKDMQNRIQAMAALHEALYRSDSLSHVDLAVYLKQVAVQLGRSLATGPGHVAINLDLVSASLNLDAAIPCGLAVNELVSNCLKHGFPAGRSGEVRVELRRVGSGGLRLSVADNGIGLPKDLEARKSKSLGLQLVSDLARQLHGELTIGPGPKTVFEMTFFPLSGFTRPIPPPITPPV